MMLAIPNQYTDKSQSEKVYNSKTDLIEEHPLLRDFFVTRIGRADTNTNELLEVDTQSKDAILTICFNGSMEIKVHDDVFKMNPGSIHLLPAGTQYSYNWNPEDSISVRQIAIRGKGHTEMLQLLGLSKKKLLVERITLQNLVSRMCKANAAFQEGITIYNMLRTSAIIRETLLSISTRMAQCLEPSDDDTIMANLIDDLHCGMNQYWTVKRMADKCSLSTSHFTRTFKDYTGKSPIEYLKNLRVKTSCEYLGLKNIPILEIAHKVGYDDPLYFSRSFKSIMNISPMKYRKKMVIAEEQDQSKEFQELVRVS